MGWDDVHLDRGARGGPETPRTAALSSTAVSVLMARKVCLTSELGGAERHAVCCHVRRRTANCFLRQDLPCRCNLTSKSDDKG